MSSSLYIADGELTQRKWVVLSHYHVYAVFEDVYTSVHPVPTLYYDDERSVVLAHRNAYELGGLISSFEQAQHWCRYHGFSLVFAEVMIAPPELSVRKCGRLFFRVLPVFDVKRYETHRQRCPDCSYHDRRKERGLVYV